MYCYIQLFLINTQLNYIFRGDIFHLIWNFWIDPNPDLVNKIVTNLLPPPVKMDTIQDPKLSLRKSCNRYKQNYAWKQKSTKLNPIK